MNKSSEVICLQFTSYAGIPFRIGISALELTIDWGDKNQTCHQGKKYYTIEHDYKSEGLYNIRIEGTQITDCSISDTNLSELSLLQCPSLESLDCSKNELIRLELQACPSLEELYCNSNNLKELNLVHSPNLSILDASYNCFEELNLQHCRFLRSVNCPYNHLKQLNIQGSTLLQDLNICHNFLDREQLNQIFGSLPHRKENAYIAYLNNPGTISADTQILKLKKWL